MVAKSVGRVLNTYQHIQNYRVSPKRSWPFALRIYCSECPKNETVQLPRGYIHTCLQSIADGAFKKKGWEIGRNRKHDVCPDCVARLKAKAAIARAQRAADNNRDSIAAREKLNAMEAERRRLAHAEAARAAPAQALSRAAPVSTPPDVAFVMESRTRPAQPRLTPTQAEHERKMDAMPPLQAGLILARLRQVFRENGTGYVDGWHDQRLADDLKVSPLWVVKVRTDKFPGSHSYDPGAGRAGFPPAINRIGDDCRVLFDEIDLALSDAREMEKRLLALAGAWRERRIGLEGRAAQIESRLYALEDRAKELADMGVSKPLVATPVVMLSSSAEAAKSAAARGAYAFRSHPLFREGAAILGRGARGLLSDDDKARAKALQRQAFEEFKSGAWAPPE